MLFDVERKTKKQKNLKELKKISICFLSSDFIFSQWIFAIMAANLPLKSSQKKENEYNYNQLKHTRSVFNSRNNFHLITFRVLKLIGSIWGPIVRLDETHFGSKSRVKCQLKDIEIYSHRLHESSLNGKSSQCDTGSTLALGCNPSSCSHVRITCHLY